MAFGALSTPLVVLSLSKEKPSTGKLPFGGRDLAATSYKKPTKEHPTPRGRSWNSKGTARPPGGRQSCRTETLGGSAGISEFENGFSCVFG